MLRAVVPQLAEQGELAARLTVALDKLLPPGTCNAVIDDALERAQLSAVPEDAVALVFFATGPLHEAVELARGEQLARAIMVELGPVLDEAWVRERRRVEADLDSGVPALSGDEVTRRESGVRRHQDVDDDETPTDVEQLMAADTIPAPTNGAAEAAAAELALRLSAPPSAPDRDDLD
ncbi:MAG: hypothetical protein DRI90_00045 [Deltaproteobacteria bacterium]|nr:MAG: hypothetical protein DRI90_00045 [Deltaproteobacteria bacterium]